MEKLYKTVVNTETGEEIKEEFTKEDYENHKKLLAEIEAGIESERQKELNRASALAKLAALGLTEDEIAAL